MNANLSNTTIVKSFPLEIWKPVEFDFEYANDYSLEVSNYGRLKTYNKINKGTLLKGSMVGGYQIVRLKFYRKRDEKTAASLALLAKQKLKLTKQVNQLAEAPETKEQLIIAQETLAIVKKKLAKKQKKDFSDRIIHFHSLIHRLVAEYYCNKPSEEHTIVAHKDFNKTNNKYTNLVWMTREENFVHQQKSPFVIEGKLNRDYTNGSTKVAKLTVTKVMLLKKLLNEGKTLRTLAKQFKITDTQILRIKRGENWKDIQAWS